MLQNTTTRNATIRIIKTTDSTFADSGEDGVTNADQRWAYYVSAFTSIEPTEGVPQDQVERPFLGRNERSAKAAASKEELDELTFPLAHANIPAIVAPDDDSAVDNTAASDSTDAPKPTASKTDDSDNATKGATSRKSKLYSSEQLGLRISLDTFIIHWALPGTGQDQEWWLRKSASVKAPAASSSKQDSRAGSTTNGTKEPAQVDKATATAASSAEEDVAMNNAPEGDGDESTTQNQTQGKKVSDEPQTSANTAQPTATQPNDGGEHDSDEHGRAHAFEEKFVMNNRWMAGLRRDEVEGKNEDFARWTSASGAVVDVDMEEGS